MQAVHIVEVCPKVQSIMHSLAESQLNWLRLSMRAADRKEIVTYCSNGIDASPTIVFAEVLSASSTWPFSICCGSTCSANAP